MPAEIFDWIAEFRKRRGQIPNIPLGDYVRRQSRDYEDEAVTEEYNRYQAKFGRADEIARRMTAKGPAPQGSAAEFMAKFISPVED